MKKRKKVLIQPKVSMLKVLRELNKRRKLKQIETPLDILSQFNLEKSRKKKRKISWW